MLADCLEFKLGLGQIFELDWALPAYLVWEYVSVFFCLVLLMAFINKYVLSYIIFK